MIFVTVGSQMPFDRLIRTVDDWAGGCRAPQMIAQIAGGDYVPDYMQWQRFISPGGPQPAVLASLNYHALVAIRGLPGRPEELLDALADGD